ncbi:endonuclease NucS [Arthrobacter sp. EH-1B-1]|uniref:Endonuclease NucS n=1 Tax=Arthrobacter vasquezii TaxID=2977629 RepID=A0ABT6CQ31_9MICC|nr:endonuclease NucS [Arthrobacter vasquezii]MDF9276247.1 endonuclease NucS [Arthrobacter vasquezii]
MSEILVRTDGGQWLEPVERGFGYEADLQRILVEHPQLIPGVGAGAVASREFQSGAGPADIVVVDPAGTLTLVECKLATNKDIRRVIVGQMFDYASGFFNMHIEEFERRWELGRKRTLQDTFGDPEVRDAVGGNLREGCFRIVLAVDAINSSLKRMVGYLNAMSGPQTSVIAVEYTRMYGSGVEVLIPRTYGLELAEEKIAVAEKNKERWTLEQNRRWVEENDAGNLARFEALVDGAAEVDIPFVGSSVGIKSDVPAGGLQIVLPSGDVVGTVYVYHYTGNSTSIEFNFTGGAAAFNRDVEAKRRFEEFLDQLGSVSVAHSAAQTLRGSYSNRRPNVRLSDLSDGDVQHLVEALSRLCSE